MDVLYPLRRAHGIMRDIFAREKHFHAAKKQYSGLPKASVILIGTPEHSNIGDSAIVLAELKMLNTCCVPDSVAEISCKDYRMNGTVIRKLIRRNAIIFLHGGGNMGNTWPHEENLRRRILKDFPWQSKMIFPQTIHYSSTEAGSASAEKSVAYYDNHPELILVAREKTSYEKMQELYPNTHILLSPDIVLSTAARDYGVTEQPREGVLFCVRSDAEKSISDAVWSELENCFSDAGKNVSYIDMYSDCTVTKENRRECVRKKMQEFCGAELVITDRLHGMIFAAITGTPCVVFSNYNHKVKGTYDWISYLPYIRYVDTAEEAKTAIPELLSVRDCQFDNAPLQPYFDKLAEVVKKLCRQ